MANRGQGIELRPVVDEIEEEGQIEKDARDNAAKGVDWDKVCAYKTMKVVRIRDRQLGFCYWGIVSTVILYVVVFAFSIEGKHQQQEPGVGTVLTKAFGKAYSGDNVYDASDIRFPVIEPSGAFLLTRKIAILQKRGMCIDWDEPKKCVEGKRKTCGEGETCKGEYCEIATWCPSLGDKNADKPPPEADVDEVHGLDGILLKIMSGIAFPSLGNKFFVTGASAGANNQFQNITVKQLLALTEPPSEMVDPAAMDLKNMVRGALIGVSFFWNCDVSADCEPSVVIKRLDSGQGFVQKRAHYRKQGGVETREALYLNGLRILVDSSGIGRQFSIVFVMIQVGSCIALIRVAGIVADNMMLYSFQFSAMRRKAYYQCKVTETKDYSDLQDRINLVEDAKARANTGAQQVGRSHGGGGSHVNLGLGGGGRGGLASAIIRGR